MEKFRIRLESLDPARWRFRAYRMDAGPDLLGAWLVDVTYGRIGARGRTIRHCLQRRATAPKRIGVGYGVYKLDDPAPIARSNNYLAWQAVTSSIAAHELNA
jgi:hypothetical protein